MPECCFAICPDGFTNVDGRCYILLYQRKTQTAAQSYCHEKYNANLVGLESQAELEAVIGWIDSSYYRLRNKDYWMSLVKNQTGHWHWGNNEDAWCSWHEGEPNNLRGDEECTVLKYYKMWDVRCSHTRDAFICEHIEPVLTTTRMSLPIFGSCKHTGCDYAENAKDFSELTGICMVGATNSSHLSACNATGKVPATYTDLRAAQKLGAQKCRCGKTSDNRLVHPMWEPTEGCGDRKGLIACADNATSPSTGFWCKSAECPEINIDYTDFTFSAQAASSWQVCSHMCRGKRRCHAWTWNYVSGSCALKVGDFGRRRLPDRISGLRYCGTAGVVECADELNTSALVVGVASFSLLVLLLLLLVVFICKKRAKKNPNVTRRNKDKATDNIYTVNTGTHAFGVRQRDVGHHNTVELYECEEIEISCHANRKRKVSDIVQHLEDETVKANTSSEVSTGKSDADLPYNKTLVKRKI